MATPGDYDAATSLLRAIGSLQEGIANVALSRRTGGAISFNSFGSSSSVSSAGLTGQVRVIGLKELIRDLKAAEAEVAKELRRELKQVGDVVRVDAAGRLAEYDVRSAAGLRVRARGASVFVVQSLRKTTGLRPDWGELQVTRALLPAMADNEGEVYAGAEAALERALRKNRL